MSDIYANELQDLKRQMAGLRDGLIPRIGGVADQAQPHLQRLLGYAETAAEFAPQVTAVLDKVLKRGEGEAGHTARNRVLLTGVVIGAALLAYDLWGGKLSAIAKDYLPQR